MEREFIIPRGGVGFLRVRPFVHPPVLFSVLGWIRFRLWISLAMCASPLERTFRLPSLYISPPT